MRTPEIPLPSLSLFWQELPLIARLKNESKTIKLCGSLQQLVKIRYNLLGTLLESQVRKFVSLVVPKGSIPRYSFIAWLSFSFSRRILPQSLMHNQSVACFLSITLPAYLSCLFTGFLLLLIRYWQKPAEKRP